MNPNNPIDRPSPACADDPNCRGAVWVWPGLGLMAGSPLPDTTETIAKVVVSPGLPGQSPANEPSLPFEAEGLLTSSGSGGSGLASGKLFGGGESALISEIEVLDAGQWRALGLDILQIPTGITENTPPPPG